MSWQSYVDPPGGVDGCAALRCRRVWRIWYTPLHAPVDGPGIDGSAGIGGAPDGAAGGGGSGGGGMDASGGGGTGGFGGTSASDGGVGDGGAACASDTFGGHAYAFCSSALSWSAARADCAAKGMHLVRIDDANENAWIESNAFVGVTRDALAVWRWLGATDQAVRGEWRWDDNGALFWLGQLQGTPQNGLYSNWVGGAPSNQNNDCAGMQFNAGGFWTDIACSLAQPYVCEQ